MRIMRAAGLALTALLWAGVAEAEAPAGARFNASYATTINGAATYTVGLALPSGVAGVTPNLSLAYNSAAGNGPVGVGWALSGLSSIARCAQLPQGKPGKVLFTVSDKLCLNGKLLVLDEAAKTYGQDGATYRTEIDEFSRVIQHGGDINSASSWFEVRTKSGAILELGNSSDSRVLAPGLALPHSWALSRFANRKGTDFTVSYMQDQGTFYPASIRYGRSALQASDVVQVNFSWVTRHDAVPVYLGVNGNDAATVKPAVMGRVALRLEKITTGLLAGGDQREYRLNWRAADKEQPRSHLSSLRYCQNATMADGDCVLLNVLTAQGYAAAPVVAASSSTLALDSSANADKWPVLYGDIDGDGYVDALSFTALKTTVRYGQNATPYLGTDSASLFDTNTGTLGDATLYPRFLADINTDGKADILRFTATGVELLPGQANMPRSITALGAATWALSTAFGVDDGYLNQEKNPRLLADVDGDGRSDIVGFHGDGVQVALNTGSGFALQPVQPLAVSGLGTLSKDAAGNVREQDISPRQMADINGDGKTDIVAFLEDGVYVALSEGSTFAAPTRWLQAYGVSQGYVKQSTHPRTLADINGDGLLDIVGFGPHDASGRDTAVAYNQGNTFAAPERLSLQMASEACELHFTVQGDNCSSTSETGYADTTSYPRFARDMNGDGYADLVMFKPDGTTAIYFNAATTAVSFQPMVVVGDDSSLANGNDTRLNRPRMLMDMNRDGLPDITDAVNGRVYVSAAVAGVAAQRITRVEDARDFRTIEYRAIAPGTETGDAVASLTLNGLVPYTGGAVVVGKTVIKTHNYNSGDPNEDIIVDQSALLAYRNAYLDIAGQRGFVGYQTMVSGSTLNGVRSEITQAQLWPFNGRILKNEVINNLNGKDYILSRSVSEFAYDATMVGNDSWYHVYQYKSTAEDYEPNRIKPAADTLTVTRDGNENPYDFSGAYGKFSTVLVVNGTVTTSSSSASGAYSTWSSAIRYTGEKKTSETTTVPVVVDNTPITSSIVSDSYDSYGNLLTRTETVSGINPDSNQAETFTAVTSNTLNPANINDWLVGQVSRTSVSKTVPNQSSQTRSRDFIYYPDGYLKQSIIEAGDTTGRLKHTTTLAYDLAGNVISTTETAQDPATGSPVNRVNTVVFDTQGRFAVSASNVLGHSSSQVFDALLGVPVTATDANGVQVGYSYDWLGRKSSERLPGIPQINYTYRNCGGQVGCGMYQNNAFVHSYLLERSGLDSSVENFGGNNHSQEIFNSRGRHVGTITRGWLMDFQTSSSMYALGLADKYNHAGQLLGKGMPTIDGTVIGLPALKDEGFPVGITYQYDIKARTVISVQTYDAEYVQSTGSSSLKQRTTGYVYDGLLTTVRLYEGGSNTAPMMSERKEYHNAIGQLITLVDETGKTTRYDYDAFGNLLRTIDPQANTIVLSYDQLGRKISMQDPDLGYWQYRYDAFGQLREQQGPVDRAAGRPFVSFTYDLLGRLIDRREPDLNSGWVYDTTVKGIGKLAESHTYTGTINNKTKDAVRSYSYDQYGRPAGNSSRIDGRDYAFRMTYNDYGRPLELLYPNGKGYCNIYFTGQNVLRQVYRVNDERAGQALRCPTNNLTPVGPDGNHALHYWELLNSNSSYNYAGAPIDGYGNPLHEGYGNGLLQYRKTDLVGRIKEVQLGTANYTTNISGIRDVTVTASQLNSNFAYDARNNLTTRSDAIANTTESYTYDLLNRLTSVATNAAQQPQVLQSQEYDAVGNITWKTGVGAYSYPASGAGSVRPHAVQGTDDGQTVRSFSYDANGNMLSGDGKSYTWTSFNMPRSITANGKTECFIYNADHERIKRYVTTISDCSGTPLSATLYINPRLDTGGTYEVDLNNDGSEQRNRHHVYAAGRAIASVETNAAGNESVKYLYQDNQGSIMLVTDSAGNAVERFRYDPWGLKAATTESTVASGNISAFILPASNDVDNLVQQAVDNSITFHTNNFKVTQPYITSNSVSVYQQQSVTAVLELGSSNPTKRNHLFVLENVIAQTDPRYRSYGVVVRGDKIVTRFCSGAAQGASCSDGITATVAAGKYQLKLLSNRNTVELHVVRLADNVEILTRAPVSVEWSASGTVLQKRLLSGMETEQKRRWLPLGALIIPIKRQDAPVRLVSVDMSALRYDTAATAVAQNTRHGYTGHEMLDNASLIHMNGRIQSPLLGRFLSPDPNVFEPGNPQDFNRYSYVHNNPLNATDPSGYNVLYENPSVYGKKSSNSGGGSTANTMVLEIGSLSSVVSVSNGEQTSTWTTRISNATIVSGQGMVSGSVTTRDYSGTEARQVMRNADQQAKAYSAYQEAVTEFNRLMSYYAAGGSCAATASCGTDGAFTYMPGDEGLAGITGQRNIFVAIWGADAKTRSVGHIYLGELDGRVILSQFPFPHGLIGLNKTLTYAQTLSAEEKRPPTYTGIVHVPDDNAFDAQVAHERGKAWWYALPQLSPLVETTNCIYAATRSLEAGGVNVPSLMPLLLPGQAIDSVRALSIAAATATFFNAVAGYK